ncbi:DNA polymerase III subunit delta' [Tepidimonas alkaliphilus]|uniref:DNA polymerase III subunit delta n=2 Tax=Tepidimonas alkaliphilus TaxID=2588942 RepID=A0A554WDQ7_9BURK|nr:DNA polymerase III subunit delta' [Tepidimonas alkaliphilus]
MAALPPWLQRQLQRLRRQRAHAVLLEGPPGLGQGQLAWALACSWLCEQPQEAVACGHCASCRAVQARTHPDLFALLPDALALELGWPLDAATQERIERKEIKPSRQIRVEATRAALAFAQTTSARGQGKVVLIQPAERLNAESANALLKTLEEPPPAVRFVLASEAVHEVLPTVRSRCVRHAMAWPTASEGLAWLRRQAAEEGLAAGEDKLQIGWRLGRGRAEEALAWLRLGLDAAAWRSLPARLAAGDWTAIADWPPARQLTLLMLLCHDALALACGAPPQHFDAATLPRTDAARAAALWRALQQARRTVEHPYQAALWSQAWAQRLRKAFDAPPKAAAR